MADKKEQNTERRVVAVDDAELRIEPDGDGPGNMTGYAARFNKWSVDLGGFVERIKPGAFEDAIEGDDIRSLKNHDSNLLLGRVSAGTLELEENKTGLRFKNPLPNTTAGRDVAEEIRRGDLSGCSFSFIVADDGDEWAEKDGVVKRTIHKFKRIFDVGPVTFPAYPDTSVAVRSLEEFRAAEAAGEVPDEPAAERKENETPPETPTTEALQASLDAAKARELKREVENDIMRQMPLQVAVDVAVDKEE